MIGIIYNIVNLIAITAVLAMGVELFYGAVVSGIDDYKPRQELAYSSSGEQDTGKPPLPSYEVITSRNLFGSVDRMAAVEEVQEEELDAVEPTTLKISLLGTVAGHEDRAYAVIEEAAGKKQGLYRVGDSVQNALVKRIRRGEVILQVGDKLEKLSMAESASARADRRRAEAPATPVAEDAATIPVSRDVVESSLTNINQLLTQVRVRPHFTDGNPDGLAVSHIRPDSIIARLGLRNGDIIKGVDGSEIKTPDDILSFYNSLRSGSDISVDVMRGGRIQTLNYSFQ